MVTASQVKQYRSYYFDSEEKAIEMVSRLERSGSKAYYFLHRDGLQWVVEEN